MDFKLDYEKRLAEIANKAEQSNMYSTLQIKTLSDNKLNELRDKVQSIINNDSSGTIKAVWIDYNYQTGRLMGLLRTVFYEVKYREQCIKELGLSYPMLEMYIRFAGNLPYAKGGKLFEGRPMMINELKEILPLIGSKLGILIESEDIADINEIRIKDLYNKALTEASDTIANAINIINYVE